MTFSKLDESLFMNVDLDIYSRSDLRPLVTALGHRVIDLYVGLVRRTYEAHLELASGRNNRPATSIILGFCKLIEGLPPAERKLWNNAKIKNFDIGIEAPIRNSHFWTAVSQEAVLATAKVGAQIAVTVYGPMKATQGSKKRAATPSTKRA